MDVLTAAQARGGPFKKVSSTHGGEYAGPCPVCGGKDRFRLWPEKEKGGGYWCRGCQNSGDLIQYYRWAEGMSYPEACQAAGTDAKKYDYVLPKLPREPVAAPFVAAQYADPATTWREHAGKFVESCNAALLESPPALRRLWDERGLTEATVRRFGLGLNSQDTYRARQAWGLPPEVSDKTGKEKKLWIPRGLVIPTRCGDDLVRVRVRRPAADTGDGGGFGPRYYFVPGSSASVMRIGDDQRAYVVVESELDALLIAQEAGDIVGIVGMGTSSSKPDAPTHDHLVRAAVILVALDADEAGQRGSVWWLERYPQAVRWTVPSGKDPGDLFRSVDVRSWILAGLPPAWHVVHPIGPTLPGLSVEGVGEKTVVGAGAPENGGQGAPRPADGVLEVGHILRHHQVRIIATAARLAVEWRQGCEVPDVAKRLSRLVFGNQECVDYLINHPARTIDGRNFKTWN